MLLLSSEHVCNHHTPGGFFLRISRTYGLSIKRYYYQVDMSVTTIPQGASFPKIGRTYGLSIKHYYYQVDMSVTTIPQGASFLKFPEPMGSQLNVTILQRTCL